MVRAAVSFIVGRVEFLAATSVCAGRHISCSVRVAAVGCVQSGKCVRAMEGVAGRTRCCLLRPRALSSRSIEAARSFPPSAHTATRTDSCTRSMRPSWSAGLRTIKSSYSSHINLYPDLQEWYYRRPFPVHDFSEVDEGRRSLDQLATSAGCHLGNCVFETLALRFQPITPICASAYYVVLEDSNTRKSLVLLPPR